MLLAGAFVDPSSEPELSDLEAIEDWFSRQVALLTGCDGTAPSSVVPDLRDNLARLSTVLNADCILEIIGSASDGELESARSWLCGAGALLRDLIEPRIDDKKAFEELRLWLTTGFGMLILVIVAVLARHGLLPPMDDLRTLASLDRRDPKCSRVRARAESDG